MSLQSKQMEVFDPFCNNFDPDAKPFDPTIKQFNPNVDPFDPVASSKPQPDLSSWQVVAAEYSGKAVAVLLSDSVLQVCTSPSFNSKCSHKGLSCLDWDTVDMGKGRSATPEPTFKSLHDSGVENFTDNSSEEIEKINRVAKWSAEASRHAKEWSADVTGHNAEWSEGVMGVHQEWSGGLAGVPQEWSEDISGQVVTTEAQSLEWSSGMTNVWPGAHTEEYHPDGYHITVEYHPTEDGYQNADDSGYDQLAGAGYQQPEEEYHQQPEEGFTSRPCYGNDPVVVFQPWDSAVLPTSESWSEGMGITLGGLSLGQEGGAKQTGCDEEVDTLDQERIREEFKRKILSNVSGVDEDAKIREDFKKQILSNLTVTEDDTSEDKIKEAFRRQVLSNLRDAASGDTINDKCDEIRTREAFKKQILSNLENP